MKHVRLCVVGGFLGAGKTTAILHAARVMLGMGMTVGVVTNDQGGDLVDTGYLRAEGLRVLEVTGGCFCCSFDEFMRKVDALSGDAAPDVILAEPVGSCTDLVATVLKPMAGRKDTSLAISPFTVLADPLRAARMMREGGAPANPAFEGLNEINYLFRKQLEEADIILLNKADTLADGQCAALAARLEAAFRGARVLPVSALSGAGMERWLAELLGGTFNHKPSPDIDYDIYGRAEQRLGWLNRTCEVEFPRPSDCRKFTRALLEHMREALRAVGDIAHIKAFAAADGACVKASVVSRDGQVSLQGETLHAARFRLLLNARACATPEQLSAIADAALEHACAEHGATHSAPAGEAFVPGWPNPTHRLA